MKKLQSFLLFFVLFVVDGSDCRAAVYKGTASKIAVYAYDPNTYEKISANEANITATLSRDGQTAAATNDVNPTEIGTSGVYIFDLNSTETDANIIVILASSTGAKTWLDPVVIYTEQSLSSYGAATGTQLTDSNNSLAGKIAAIDTNSPKAEILAKITDSNNNMTGRIAALNDPNAAEIATAVFDSNGITRGGNWTFKKALKIIIAWSAGKWQDKAGSAGTYQVMDAEDCNKEVLTVTPKTTTPQKVIEVNSTI
jgi:hypothetical protein